MTMMMLREVHTFFFLEDSASTVYVMRMSYLINKKNKKQTSLCVLCFLKSLFEGCFLNRSTVQSVYKD